MSPQQKLLPLSSSPLISYTTPSHTHSLLARNDFWPRQGDPARDVLEARELEQKRHPDGLPRILELLPVLSKVLWQLPSQAEEAAGKFQSLSFGVGLNWFTIEQR